jgi:hypothetical protein
MSGTGELTLADVVRAQPPPTGPEVLRLAADAAELLADAHRRGYVHGEIRAEAIVVTAEGAVRLLPPAAASTATAQDDQRAFGAMLRSLLGTAVPPPVRGAIDRTSSGGYRDLDEVAAALRAAGSAEPPAAPSPTVAATDDRRLRPLLLASVVVGLLGVAAAALVADPDDEGERGAATTSTSTTEATASTTDAPFVELDDETGVLVVEVPAAWDDVDRRPNGGRPTVQASTDLERFATFDYGVPGVRYEAVDVAVEPAVDPSDPDGVLDALIEAPRGGASLAEQCRSVGRQDYDDGLFTGRAEQLTACGGAADVVLIVAAPRSRTFSVIVEVRLPPGEPDVTLERIVQSFNISGFP